MTAVGYARNQDPFQELADRVPLARLESLFQNESSVDKNAVRLQALLMGTAGFLPSQRPACEYSPCEDYAYVQKLETAWETMPPVTVMDISVWQSFRMRPVNSPLRRIAGCASFSNVTGQRGSYRDWWIWSGLFRWKRAVIFWKTA